ncbi:DUF1648 domain-containing protein [Actinomycetota bacterium]
MSGEDWREREARRQAAAGEAKGLPRQPAGATPRVALLLATLLWLAVLVWQWLTLPDRVPTHWSTSSAPDGWASRAGQLWFALLTPLLFVYPMIWLSKLCLYWPGGINIRHKEWWLETPARLIRFERMVREDMMWFAVLLLLLMTGADISIGIAAHRPGGQMPALSTVLLVAGSLIGVLAFVIRVSHSRYRPQDSDPALT